MPDSQPCHHHHVCLWQLAIKADLLQISRDNTMQQISDWCILTKHHCDFDLYLSSIHNVKKLNSDPECPPPTFSWLCYYHIGNSTTIFVPSPRLYSKDVCSAIVLCRLTSLCFSTLYIQPFLVQFIRGLTAKSKNNLGIHFSLTTLKSKNRWPVWLIKENLFDLCQVGCLKFFFQRDIYVPHLVLLKIVHSKI